MTGLTKDAGISRLISAAPGGVLRPVFRFLLWLDARTVKGDDTPLRRLVPTLRPELAEVRATEGTLDDYRRVSAQVLLMQARNAAPLITGTLDARQRGLPRSERVEVAAANHGAAQDQGSPLVIADAVRAFLRDPAGPASTVEGQAQDV